MRPLEAAPIFLKSRVRLLHQVPVKEVLEFVKITKDEADLYWHIRKHVDTMVRDACFFFVKDACWLENLRWHIESGRYRVSCSGADLLSKRLDPIYTDGIEYQAATDILRSYEIQPVKDLNPEILESEKKASLVRILCKKIGEETGVQVSILTTRIR
jgi:hypothetical protein